MDLDLYKKHNLSKLIEREIYGDGPSEMAKEYNLEYRYSDKIKNLNFASLDKR